MNEILKRFQIKIQKLFENFYLLSKNLETPYTLQMGIPR